MAEGIDKSPEIPDRKKYPYGGAWNDQSRAWQDGWEDSFRGEKTFVLDRDEVEYNNGFSTGCMWQVDSGEISHNKAREMMGLPPAEGSMEMRVPEVEFDPVKIPSHYNSGQIEVANFIADQQLDYNHGNVIKYVARAGKKNPHKELEDLEKAAAYLQMVYNVAKGLPAVVRDPETKEVVWSLFKN